LLDIYGHRIAMHGTMNTKDTTIVAQKLKISEVLQTSSSIKIKT